MRTSFSWFWGTSPNVLTLQHPIFYKVWAPDRTAAAKQGWLQEFFVIRLAVLCWVLEYQVSTTKEMKVSQYDSTSSISYPTCWMTVSQTDVGVWPLLFKLLGPGWNLVSQWPWLVLLFSLWLRTTHCWDRRLGGWGVRMVGPRVAHIAFWILLENWSLVCLFRGQESLGNYFLIKTVEREYINTTVLQRCGSFVFPNRTKTRSFLQILQVFLWALSGIWAYWSCWHSP